MALQTLATTSDRTDPYATIGLDLVHEWTPQATLESVDACAHHDLTPHTIGQIGQVGQVGRRQVSKAIVTMVVGAALLEPIERRLTEPDAHPATLVAPSEPSDGQGRLIERIGPRPLLGSQELEQLEVTAEQFRLWDHQFGGGLRRRAVIGQLAEVCDILRGVNGRVRTERHESRLFGVLAQLADTAATMSWDCGDGAAAQRYYLLALKASKHSGDSAFGANVLAGMARQLLYLGRPDDAEHLVTIAWDQLSPDAPEQLRSMLKTRQAWSYAMRGRVTAFRRATDQATEALSHAPGAASDVPSWIHYFDGAELAGVTGGRLLEMARADKRLAAEAAMSIEQAIALRPAGVFRASALDHLGLAEARLRSGEPDEAARVATAALHVLEQTRSQRAVAQTQELIQALDSAPTAALVDVRQRLRTLVAA